MTKREVGQTVNYKRFNGTESICTIISINGHYPLTGEEHYTLQDIVTDEIFESAWEKDRYD